MLRAEAPGQLADHVVVLAASPGGSISLARHLEDGVAARGVEVVVLEERRGRQHDVGEGRRLGQELLVHADEQVLAREAARAPCSSSGQTIAGLVFWTSIAVTGGPPFERLGVAGQDRPEARLVELADRAVDHVEPFDQRLRSSG